MSKDFTALLQAQDEDRYLASVFAAPSTRAGLHALYAFNYEIARIAEATSESLIGEMKLTWWRDAVEDLYLDPARIRRHDVTEALALIIHHLPKAELLSLVAARVDDVSARPFEDLDDILAYVDASATALMRLALRACGAELDEDQLRSAGRAWGLTGLLRAFPMKAQIGRAPVPGDRLAQLGGSAAMMAQGLGEEKVTEALEPVVKEAQIAYSAFRDAGPVPADAMPALGYVVLVPRYLKHLPTSPYALAGDLNPLGRRLRLSWASLTGR